MEPLVRTLQQERGLAVWQYRQLLEGFTPDLAAYAADLARREARRVYGNRVFVRGLIEFSNYCKNDCLYCGIRKSNKHCQRFRLTDQQVLECCAQGYDLGFRTFVLQSGEDPYFTAERLCALVAAIKAAHPDCAVTLSVGERPRADYERFRQAGADRYLLRHEAASPACYARLHPAGMEHGVRLECVRNLLDLGFTTGMGFMVGAPYQELDHLAQDLKLVQRMRPHMVGIGPFVASSNTPFAGFPNGSVELTCFLLSLLRLMNPYVLLPATTALGTLDPQGREKGILAGANVVMPNLSPLEARSKYQLYNNKAHGGPEAAENLADLKQRVAALGYQVVVDRGDPVPPAE